MEPIENSKLITNKFIQVLEAFVYGHNVQCRTKGNSGWHQVKEVGFMRHQWDTRNEDYRVISKLGSVLLEIGREFDDKLSKEDHENLQRQAFFEARDILTDANEKVWIHHCVKKSEATFIRFGEQCPDCNDDKKPTFGLISNPSYEPLPD